MSYTSDRLKGTDQFTDEDIAFLKDLNSPDRGTPIAETVKQGWIRDLDFANKQHLENIFKRVINPGFVLCFHCAVDVMDMVRTIYGKYEATPADIEPLPEIVEPVVTEPVVTEPVVTEPVVTEPVVTEPVVTEPVVTEPVTQQTTEGKKSRRKK